MCVCVCVCVCVCACVSVRVCLSVYMYVLLRSVLTSTVRAIGNEFSPLTGPPISSQFTSQVRPYPTTLQGEKLFLFYYPGQKNRYSRDIHEIDQRCDHVISCDINFDLQRELATRSAAGHVNVESKLDITRSHC